MADFSDDSPRTDDPTADQQQRLKTRLRDLDKEQLVELAAQLTTTYVLEGLSPIGLVSDGPQQVRPYDAVGDETFAGMLRRLKASRPGDPILEKFIINGEHIQVKTPMGNVDVTEYRRAQAPAAPAPTTNAPPPSVPAPRDSVYNRELYQPPGQRPAQPAPAARPAQQPAPAAQPGQRPAQPAPAQQPGARPAQQPAPAQQGNQQQPKKDEPKPGGERFRMIELD